jgi:hypothetical protein
MLGAMPYAVHAKMLSGKYSDDPAFTGVLMGTLRNAAIGSLLALAKLYLHSDGRSVFVSNAYKAFFEEFSNELFLCLR